MNYIIEIIKRNNVRLDVWISFILYWLFLILPLFSMYRHGGPQPIYNILYQTYSRASTGVFLITLACFPFTKSIIDEIQNKLLFFSLIRTDVKFFLRSHLIANIFGATILVALANSLAIMFINLYLPLDITDESFLLSMKQSYWWSDYLGTSNYWIYYFFLVFTQLSKTLFYLMLTLVLSSLITDSLLVSAFPLVLNAILRNFLPSLGLPLFLIPNSIFSPLKTLGSVYPTFFRNDLIIIIYICFVLLFSFVISLKLMEYFVIRHLKQNNSRFRM